MSDLQSGPLAAGIRPIFRQIELECLARREHERFERAAAAGLLLSRARNLPVACEGRAFNALTKTPMVHLRKRERWLDRAWAMIDGQSLAKTVELCGVHPTTAFRWRHRFLGPPAADKPRTPSGIVEADENFILESFKGRWSDLPRKGRTTRRNGPPSGPSLSRVEGVIQRLGFL